MRRRADASADGSLPTAPPASPSGARTDAPTPGALVARAALLYLVVGVALRLLPLRRTLALVRRLARPRGRAGAAPDWPLAAAAWAVGRAGRFFPLARCLPQALVAHVLLRRAGHPSRVVIGVARGEDVQRALLAHAWVESAGVPVVGLSAGRSYALLAPLDV